MCGRFAIFSSLKGAMAFIRYVDELGGFDGTFNAAPGQMVPVLSTGGPQPRLSLMKWGLVPFWSKDEKIGYKLINARSETVGGKPGFRAAYQRRRCVIPANGFYEWKKPEKQPYFIHLQDRPLFFFAGLWESWKKDSASEPLETFTILTTEPHPKMKDIHNRMPVILSEGEEIHWLEPEKEAAQLLQPYPGDDLIFHPVSRKVNSPGNDFPELIQATDSA